MPEYTTRARLDLRFGSENVSKWADKNNNTVQDEIDAAVTQAIITVSSRIDSRLRRGPYTVPFAAPYPEEVVDAATVLAGVMLYEERGLTDSQESSDNQLRRMRRDAEADLNRIAAGAMHLALPRRTSDGPATVDLT